MSGTRKFRNEATAVKAARQFVLESMADTPREVREVAELLVSELATNCVRHTTSDFEITVSRPRGSIRIAVTDGGGGEPSVQPLHPDSVSGRGLALVQMLSSSWGITPAAGGKTVWLSLETQDRRVPASTATRADGRAGGQLAAG